MKLLTPYELFGEELKNRVVLAPLTRARAGASRIPNKLMTEYYSQRSGAGLLISEATSISKDGVGWLNNAAIWSNEQEAGWKGLIKEINTPMVLQLWHCGRASHSSFVEREGKLPAAPSAIRIEGDEIHTPVGKVPYETPRELTVDEIKQTVLDYQEAAARGKRAGFSAIEIHSANGYLLDEFLQSKTNKRSDQYGGSLDNRLRLLTEVIEACLSVYPSECIGVRFSPNGNFNGMGSPDYVETFLEAARRVNDFGLGYIHVMDGLAFGFHELGEPMNLGQFRKVFNQTIIGNCGYTKETAEAAISEGNADLIAFGRPFISNPDLVERFRNNWPLAPEADVSTWFSFEEEGYTDFPAYQAA